MPAKRKLKLVITLIGLLVLGGGWLIVSAQNHPSSQPAQQTQAKSKPKYRTLTLDELHHDPTLTYCSIIYYTVKHGKIQRWQEVSKVSLGWQIEQYPTNDGFKVLVWPDMNIKKEAKQLQPNWFALTKNDSVTYHSFIIHSFRDDMTATTNLKTIVDQINHDHAAMKVRQMTPKMLIVKHKNSAN
ncbi:hypothetical protein RA086_11960 [Lactiplantibacillus sp. WILCCON 0030]|uniref:Uncharacterized protein n=1 Tax=Lactiplantibacillus brownii TaxID=3069269 RepID=A0ABU1ABH7_9LACO|nr:hypothetical protein [Lactiplantibacillus brownii]MDQ7938324.1 hypothetical protein [Lactiplantibacillus brownii]